MQGNPAGSERASKPIRKWPYYIFAVVAVFFLQLQITQLWNHRKRVEFTLEELAQRKEMLTRKLADKSFITERKNISLGPTASAELVSDLSHKDLAVPRVKARPEATPIESFSYPVHVGRSRIYVYFVHGKTRLKVDLFHDLYNAEVGQFVSDILNCREAPRNKNQSELSIKWVGIPTQDLNSTYKGLLMVPNNNKNLNFILVKNPSRESVKDFKLIGGEISEADSKEDHDPGEQEINYKKSNILFTYVENEEPVEQFHHFQKVVSQIKAGCKK